MSQERIALESRGPGRALVSATMANAKEEVLQFTHFMLFASGFEVSGNSSGISALFIGIFCEPRLDSSRKGRLAGGGDLWTDGFQSPQPRQPRQHHHSSIRHSRATVK